MTSNEHKERFFRTLAYTCWTMALLCATHVAIYPMNRWGATTVAAAIIAWPLVIFGSTMFIISGGRQKRGQVGSQSAPR
jgi:hypothetical protein